MSPQQYKWKEESNDIFVSSADALSLKINFAVFQRASVPPFSTDTCITAPQHSLFWARDKCFTKASNIAWHKQQENTIHVVILQSCRLFSGTLEENQAWKPVNDAIVADKMADGHETTASRRVELEETSSKESEGKAKVKVIEGSHDEESGTDIDDTMQEKDEASHHGPQHSKVKRLSVAVLSNPRRTFITLRSIKLWSNCHLK